MNFSLYLITFICLNFFILFAQSKTPNQNDDITVTLEHSLAYNKPFVSRGRINYRMSTAKASLNPIPLSTDDLNALQKLAEEDGWYRVRVVFGNSNDPSHQISTTANIKACLVVESNLVDKVKLHVNPQGTVVDLDYFTPVSKCNNSTKIRAREFETTVVLDVGVDGKRPSRPQPVPTETEQQSQSWFSRNSSWIMLAVGAFLVMSFITPPEEEQGGAQGASGAQGAQSGQASGSGSRPARR